MNPEDKKLIGAVEAVLFGHGEEISLKKLAAAAKIPPAALEEVLAGLEKGLALAGGGLALLRRDDRVSLVTAPDFKDLISDLVKNEFQENLTPAAQETLAIIAYGGPVSRGDIEYVRGANSSFTLRHLLMRGLVDRAPHPQRANTYLYSLTADCLRHLGLTSPAGLPEYAKYKDFTGKIFEEAQKTDKSTEV